MTEQYDYIVIGGGSGGIASVNRAASFGKKCLLIEAQKLGGTCVNVGCVPKKVMWYAASVSETLRKFAPDYGFDNTIKTFDYNKLIANRSAYIDRIHQSYQNGLQKNNVDVIKGHAKFIDKHTVTVNNQEFSAPHILIAVGGKPYIPNIEGAELGIDSDGFFALSALPKKTVIVGGGYIGVELAGVLANLGSDVTLVIRKSTVLAEFDSDITATLMQLMQDNGIQIVSGASPTKITKNNEISDNTLSIALNNGDTLVAQTLIWATGRTPNTADLSLEKAGVSVNEQGYIITDKFQNTATNGVYAVGDVIADGIPLTPVAVAAGRRLSERLFNNKPKEHLDYNLVPTVIFSHPPIATIGKSETCAKKEYGENAIKVYTATFTPMFSAITSHREPCKMKLICQGDNERIVGLHAIGFGVDEMLQGFAVAIKMGATKQDFDNTVAIHPTGSEEFVTMR